MPTVPYDNSNYLPARLVNNFTRGCPWPTHLAEIYLLDFLARFRNGGKDVRVFAQEQRNFPHFPVARISP